MDSTCNTIKIMQVTTTFTCSKDDKFACLGQTAYIRVV